MKTIKTVCLFICLIYSVFSQETKEITPDVIYEKYKNSIVMVFSYDGDNALMGYGSGVIVSNDGLVYTNFHVIDNVTRIEIRNGSDIYDSIPIVGLNTFLDAAILKLPAGSYTKIPISKSEMRVGSYVYTFGNPLGYTKTFSLGVISAFRNNEDNNQIQISAPISPGSSGGALLNSYGELIGITSSTFTKGQNMNFAIPIKVFTEIPIFNLDDKDQKELSIKTIPLLMDNQRVDFDNKVSTINSYIELFNNDTIKFEYAGRLYNYIGEFDSAIIYLTKAIELNLNNKVLYQLRANIYKEVSDTIHAINDYEKAISLCDNCIDLYIDRAKFYQYYLKDYLKAIDDYNKIIKINPEYDYVNTEKATCWINLNDKYSALKELSKSILWNAQDPKLYRMRGDIHKMMDMNNYAIEDYTSAILYSSAESDLYLDIAILYSKEKDYDNAIKNYNEYLKFEPEDEVALNNLAYAYMNIQEYEKAEYFFKMAISRDKYHSDSYIGLAIMNIRQGKIKLSIQSFIKAIEINDVLLNGMPGIKSLENSRRFWNNKEKKDIKKIFKVMGIKDTPLEIIKDPRPKSPNYRTKAESSN